MTPHTIAGSASSRAGRRGSLTDHNTQRQLRRLLPSRRGLRLLALPGMELCTREEVHIVCVFPDLERAGAFQEEVYRSLGEARNDPAIFGRQLYLDTDDRVLGEESRLLAGATAIGVYEVPALVERYGGAAWPAHIDRPSFSLLSNLGLWDPGLGFSLAEVSRNCPPDFMPGRRDLRGVPTITGCDAHYLEQISDTGQFMEVPARSREAVLAWLRRGGA